MPHPGDCSVISRSIQLGLTYLRVGFPPTATRRHLEATEAVSGITTINAAAR